MPLGRAEATVRALADTLLPEDGDAPPGSAIVPEALEDLLASMDAADAKQLTTVLGVFEVGAIPLHGRRFTRLSPAARERYLRGWMTSRIAPRRQIYRALRNLFLNLYYGHPAAWPHLGYEGPPVAKERAS